MESLIAAVTHAAEVVERVVGTDVLASLAGLALIVVFFYIEGGSRPRGSH